MLTRVAQPPIDPARRPAEQHSFWPGLVPVLVGVAFLLCGATHITEIETTEGGAAREFQLVKAFARGGLHFSGATAPLDRSILNDPNAAAAAF
jgi:hypothetical protein